MSESKTKGIKLAALYGFTPHRLGFCGPREKSATRQILNFLADKNVSEREMRKILGSFHGAFFYYKLIAEANNIADPFDEQVVKAYWVGNKLLDRVEISALRKTIVEDFSRPGLLKKREAVKKAAKIPLISKPHHSFHILAIGSITNRICLRGKLIDVCRVSWGKVIKKIRGGQKPKIVVEYQPLIKKNKKYAFGKAVKKELFWERLLLPKVKIGDWVSIHWNRPIQVLGKRELANLKKYTRLTIDSLNNPVQ